MKHRDISISHPHETCKLYHSRSSKLCHFDPRKPWTLNPHQMLTTRCHPVYPKQLCILRFWTGESSLLFCHQQNLSLLVVLKIRFLQGQRRYPVYAFYGCSSFLDLNARYSNCSRKIFWLCSRQTQWYRLWILQNDLSRTNNLRIPSFL